MGRHVNSATGVVFTVDDSKDERYAQASGLYEPAPADEPSKAAPKKAAASK